MEFETFATVDEIQARLDFIMDDQERIVAESIIEDASDLARDYGRDWPTRASAPRIVLMLVRRAVARHMKNISGHTVDRAGDENLQRSDAAGEHMADVYFTEGEQRQLAKAAGTGMTGLVSVGIYAHSSGRRDPFAGWVRFKGDEMRPTKPFPMFEGEGPW